MTAMPNVSTEARALLVGGVYLGKGRLKLAGQAVLAARNGLESRLKKADFLGHAPFQTINLILRYGPQQNLDPEIGEIDRAHAELPVAVQVDLNELNALELGALTKRLTEVMIEVLLDVAANFDLPHEFLAEMQKELAHRDASPQ